MSNQEPDWLSEMPDDPVEEGYPMPDITFISSAHTRQPVLKINGCLPLPPGSIIELYDHETHTAGDVVVTQTRYRPDSRSIMLYVTEVDGEPGEEESAELEA